MICFDRVLAQFQEDDIEVFVARVAEEYLMELIRQAHIPIRYVEQLRADVMTEVHETLKIRSYGCVNFGEFLNRTHRRRSAPAS